MPEGVHPVRVRAVPDAQVAEHRRMVHSKPALLASLFLIGGIILALYVNIPLGVAFGLSLGVLFVCSALFLLRAKTGIVLLSFAILIVSLGFLRGTESIARKERNAVAEFISNHPKAAVWGRIFRLESYAMSRSKLLLANASLVTPEDTLRLASLRIEVRGSSLLDTLRAGDWLLTGGRFRIPEDPRVPGQMGRVRKAVIERIAAYLYIGDESKLLHIPSKEVSPARAIHVLRQKIIHILEIHLSPEASSLCRALFLGDRSGFSQEFRGQLNTTGLSHIFALSGLNVGLIASLVWLIAAIFGVPFTLRIWISLFATVLYVALGFGVPSVMRAGIMCSIFLVGHLIHRKVHVLNIIGSAAFLELLCWPMDLVDVGFQLSYLAVLGMVLTYSWMKAVAVKIFGYKLFSKPFVRSVAEVSFATFSAQIGTLPLLATVFGTVPFLGLFANLFAVPAFAILLWWEVFLLLTAPIIPWVATSVGVTINVFSSFLYAFVEWFSELPGASLATGYLSPIALAGTLIGLGIAWYQFGRFQWRRATIGALIILNALIWPQVIQSRKVNFEIYFLDVGNGDSILLHTPEGKAVLIDAGPAFASWDASWRILPALRSLGVQRLDALVLTHIEMDHIGGAQSLIREFPVEAIYTNGLPRKMKAYQNLLHEIKTQGIEVKPLLAGEILDELYPFPLWVLSPDSIWHAQGINQNQRSLVVRLDIGKTSALFTADIDSITEQRLLVWEDDIRSELLKVPHHGSKYSSSIAFLTAVQPEVAIITAGRRNPHGHPTEEVLTRLERLNIPFYITGKEGTLQWISDGEAIRKGWWRKSTLSLQWHLPTIDTAK